MEKLRHTQPVQPGRKAVEVVAVAANALGSYEMLVSSRIGGVLFCAASATLIYLAERQYPRPDTNLINLRRSH